MNRNSLILGLFILALVAGFFLVRNFRGDEFDLPIGGETTKETIVIEDGQVVGTKEELEERGKLLLEDEEMEKRQETKEIMITNGIKHSIPFEELLAGGPPKDGIPPIDNPKFILIEEANQWLGDTEPGVAFSRGNTHRFYPYKILVWHEIVNDTIDGQRVLITYCPLCFTGFVLDPIVQGERVEFGTSGRLWKSNLVMYDRKTDSLWSQVLAEAIVGEMTGTKLPILPSDQVRYGEWKKAYPDGQVLSQDTGSFRDYDRNPYGGYSNVTNLSLQLANPTDTRLPNDAFIFGIVINGKPKAYSTEAVKAKGEVEDVFEGEQIILRHDPSLDVVRMFKKLEDGSEERINPISAFWFSWSVAHPDTELYK
ncbi:DUF3179 domain-containing protein [Patescibacteria group bacterium]|nr:DUF3179 domain-containing protein [Patescibacteria group bacterium]